MVLSSAIQHPPFCLVTRPDNVGCVLLERLCASCCFFGLWELVAWSIEQVLGFHKANGNKPPFFQAMNEFAEFTFDFEGVGLDMWVCPVLILGLCFKWKPKGKHPLWRFPPILRQTHALLRSPCLLGQASSGGAGIPSWSPKSLPTCQKLSSELASVFLKASSGRRASSEMVPLVFFGVFLGSGPVFGRGPQKNTTNRWSLE